VQLLQDLGVAGRAGGLSAYAAGSYAPEALSGLPARLKMHPAFAQKCPRIDFKL